MNVSGTDDLTGRLGHWPWAMAMGTAPIKPRAAGLQPPRDLAQFEFLDLARGGFR